MIQAIKPKQTNQLEKAKRFPIKNIFNGQLKVSGSTLLAICPFHDDHNPSMGVYPTTNSFYCFACHETGDVIKLYMKIYNLDFKDAVKEMGK